MQKQICQRISFNVFHAKHYASYEMKQYFLNEVNVGSIIQVGIDASCIDIVGVNTTTHTMEVEVIGKYSSGERCIAWNGKLYQHSYPMAQIDRFLGSSYNMSEAYRKYDRFKWAQGNIIVNVIPQDIIVSPNQVCAECKLPAPHAKPNVGDTF